MAGADHCFAEVAPFARIVNIAIVAFTDRRASVRPVRRWTRSAHFAPRAASVGAPSRRGSPASVPAHRCRTAARDDRRVRAKSPSTTRAWPESASPVRGGAAGLVFRSYTLPTPTTMATISRLIRKDGCRRGDRMVSRRDHRGRGFQPPCMPGLPVVERGDAAPGRKSLLSMPGPISSRPGLRGRDCSLLIRQLHNLRGRIVHDRQLGRAQALELVAQPRGLLEVEIGRGCAHPRFEIGQHRPKLWPMVAASSKSPPSPAPVETSTWSRS